MTKKTEKAATPVLVSADKLFQTEAEMNKAMEVAEKNGETLQKQYQRIAASILVHLAKNKDIRLVRRMIDKFPESLRKNSMLTYLEKFGNVRVLSEGDTLKGAFKDMEVGTIVYDETRKLKLADALATAWWKAKPEAAYKPLDLNNAIGQLIAMTEKRIAKGVSQEKGDNVDVKLLEKLKAIHKAA